jgi:hypothetical protein
VGEGSVKREKILNKLRRTYIKTLRRYALGHMIKARELEDKAIRLELKLRDVEDER